MPENENEHAKDSASSLRSGGANSPETPNKRIFQDTWERAQALTETTDEKRHRERHSTSPDILAITAQALEYQQAGRNTALFCRKLSAQAKRPVLVLNTPRTAAFLQTGFRHWLTNFPNEEIAQQFIDALHVNISYAQEWQQLRSAIDHLRFAMQETERRAEKEQKEKGWTITPYDRKYDDDPSQDIRNEIYWSGRFVDYHHPPDSVLPRPENIGAINAALMAVYESKDRLRALILAQAAQWLEDGRMTSFVYPINHWKLSGSGEWRPELAYASHKLLHSATLPATIVVFTDVHENFSESNETQPRQHMAYIGDMYQKYKEGEKKYKSWERNGNGIPFAEWLATQNMIAGTLKYPWGEPSGGHGPSIHKDLLKNVHRGQPKVIDLHVLLPSQLTFDEKHAQTMATAAQDFWDHTVRSTGKSPFQHGGQVEEQYRALAFENRDHYNAATRGWWKIGRKRHAGEDIFTPDHVMKPSQFQPEDMVHLRQIIEQHRKNPQWIFRFRDHIPLEANYSYAGTDYEQWSNGETS